MAIVKTNVKIEVDNRQALRESREVRREMDRIEDDAKDAQREVNNARRARRGLNDRATGLLDRAKSKGILKEEGLELGPLALTRTGIRGSEEFMKGKGQAASSAVAAPLMAVFATKLVADALTSIGDRAADLRDEGLNTGQVVSSMMKGGLQYAAEPSAGLARMASRWTDGYTREQADLALDDLLVNAFGSGKDPSQIDQILDAQKLQRRAFLAQQTKIQEAERQAADKKEAALDAALAKLDEALSQRLAGLKIRQLPIRVPEWMYRKMESDAWERERLKADILKRRVSEGVGS